LWRHPPPALTREEGDVTTVFDDYFQAHEVCTLLNRSVKSLDRMVKENRFPAPLPGTGGSGKPRFWRKADVLKALKERGK
jgi:hypothetical protein